MVGFQKERGIYDENGLCIGLKPNTLPINDSEPPMLDYRWKKIGKKWVFNEDEKDWKSKGVFTNNK